MRPGRDGPIGPADFGVDEFSVPVVLDRRAKQYPDRVMMSIAGTEMTFEQMRKRSCAAANTLLDLGIGRGDCVALFTATCPEWVYFWLGAARIGAMSAAVNAANKGDFLLHTLQLSRATVIITDGKRRLRVEEVADRLETLTDIVVQGDSLDDALTRGASRAVEDKPAQVGEVGRCSLLRAPPGRRKRLPPRALPVLGGRDRRLGLGIRSGRTAVDRHAPVSPQCGTQRFGADACRRDHRAGERLSSWRGVG